MTDFIANNEFLNEQGDQSSLEFDRTKFYIRVANNLRRARLSKHLTQRDMATLFGVTLQTYQQYEYGKVHPDLYGFVRLCLALKINLLSMLGYKTNSGASTLESFEKDNQIEIIKKLIR